MLFVLVLLRALVLQDHRQPIAGRSNVRRTITSGSATLPFLVSQPGPEQEPANCLLLVLPGRGHFYAESNTPLPWQDCIELFWKNPVFRKAMAACAWPAAGQPGSPPAWLVPENRDWTTTTYTLHIPPFTCGAKRGESSPFPSYIPAWDRGGRHYRLLACLYVATA